MASVSSDTDQKKQQVASEYDEVIDQALERFQKGIVSKAIVDAADAAADRVT